MYTRYVHFKTWVRPSPPSYLTFTNTDTLLNYPRVEGIYTGASEVRRAQGNLLLGLLYIVGRGWSVTDWSWSALHHYPWNPCFQVLVPDSMMYMREGLKITSGFRPTWIPKERLREGRPKPNLQILLQWSCSWWGELAGTEVPEEYGPYWLRLCSGTTPLRKGGSRSAATTLSDVHHPEERLTEYWQFSNLTLFSILWRSAPIVLFYSRAPTLSMSWPSSGKAKKSGPFKIVTIRTFYLEFYLFYLVE